MSRMSELMIDIADELEKGELSFAQIAEKFEVPVEWVIEAACLDIEENEGIQK